MSNVSVYLGSSPNAKPAFWNLAFEVGRRIALEGHTLVYGGAGVGTMGALADGAIQEGGKVIGVFPLGFQGTREVRESGVKVKRDDLTQMIDTADFAERKQVMEDLCDCCIVLPGSYGTMDELFTFACNRAIDKHQKTIYVYNFEGYYQPLVQLIANMSKCGFLKPVMADAVVICDTLDEIFEKIKQQSD